MNLKLIADAALIKDIEKLVRQEREILTSVLHHLREIDSRRLFSSMGYKSLFEFTVRYLGYPEDQAYRRIAAMKLIKEIPEVEEKINQGLISLSHIGLAQSLFKNEKKMNNELSREAKLQVFDQIANKSVRQAERITLSLSSSPVQSRPDRMNSISSDLTELRFTASGALQEKVKCLKGLLAHKYPNISLGELFEKLCDLGLSEWGLAKTAAPRKRRVTQKTSQAQTRRDIFQRAKNQCQNCSSTYALEIDHVAPKAKGGSSKAENLRVLCRNCNQRAAITEFGQITMDRYVN